MDGKLLTLREWVDRGVAHNPVKGWVDLPGAVLGGWREEIVDPILDLVTVAFAPLEERTGGIYHTLDRHIALNANLLENSFAAGARADPCRAASRVCRARDSG